MRQLRLKVEARCKDLLDEWSVIAKELRDAGGSLQYQTEAGGAQRLLYEFLNPELKTLPSRHKGKEYIVLGVARHSETDEELVVYRQDYSERRLWVRPLAMFLETVQADGRRVPRFQFVGEE